MSLKVAIICHFSNQYIRNNLFLNKGHHYAYKDFGLWNENIIKALSCIDDMEVHVIIPHMGMKKDVQEFKHKSTMYHVFMSELPYPWNHIEYHLYSQEKRNFPRNRKIVKGFISQIKPDVVLLIGAENPYYSTAGLDVEGIPLMIHLQTVYANPDRIKNAGSIDKRRWDVEVALFKKTPYVACTGRMYYDLVKGYNPDAIVFPRRWPSSKFPEIPEVCKHYDFVYFARYLNKNKGFDNAIEAMGLFIKAHPDARFLAVGSPDENWQLFENRIEELGLKSNLEIHGSFEEYTDLLKCVKQARFALLPITMDVLSGTIMEAMRMGMPVVTCRTSGTPSLNENRETVLISDIGDCNGLCENMERLYNSEELANHLRENAFKYLEEKDELNANNVNEMVTQLQAVINHYHNATPVPQELLFKTEDSIDYRKK